MMSLNCQMVLIQCQTFKIISSASSKKHKTLSTNSLIHIYIKRINNRLVLKVKDRYNLETQTPETMKLFGNPKSYAKQRMKNMYLVLK